MDRVKIKVAVIMVALGGIEAWPLLLSLGRPDLARYARIYGLGANPPLAGAAAALVAIAYCGYTIARFPSLRRRLLEASWLKLLAIPFALITGSFEEIFFRKGLMDLTAAHGVGWEGQVAASAVIFGTAHLIWGLFGRGRRMAWGAFAATSALGAALAGVYLLTGRDLAACMWAHIAINLVIEPWMLVSAVTPAAKTKAEARRRALQDRPAWAGHFQRR